MPQHDAFRDEEETRHGRRLRRAAQVNEQHPEVGAAQVEREEAAVL